jgi:hypothetical protein
MRTKRTLEPQERRIFHPELQECPLCGTTLHLCGYWRWDKVVQTLEGVIAAASRPSRCTNPACPAPQNRYVSAVGAALALPESTYGLDVVVRVGWLREHCHRAMAESQADLQEHGVQITVRHVSNLWQDYLALVACAARLDRTRLDAAVAQHGGLLLALDGLQPEGGDEQLWFGRELFTGLTLHAAWLPVVDEPTLQRFLTPVAALSYPVLAVLSDKEQGVPEAVQATWPGVRHQYCQVHYLGNMVDPLYQQDRHLKTQLAKEVRQQVRPTLSELFSPGGATH